MYGEIIVDDSYFVDVDGNTAFVAAEGNLKEFIRHIRYTKENDSSFLGLPIGTAQIIDVFETAYIALIIGEFKIAEMKKEEFLTLFDSVVASRIIPQMDGFDYMKLNSFYSAISERPEFARFLKTKRAIYNLIY